MKQVFRLILIILFLGYTSSINAQISQQNKKDIEEKEQGINPETGVLNLNKKEREQWFTSLGFGMFIHFSVDAQLGSVISHSLVGASDDYFNRYVNELPKTFNPDKFDAEQWAQDAKMAGMKYAVFTTKHHNGFCMFDTKTTAFNIMNTPYGKDITKLFVDAFRKVGIAIGFYFSPEDFYFLKSQGNLVSRVRPETAASKNPALNEYAKKQMKELMSNYGKIDIIFLDGIDQYGMTELAKICWSSNPDAVVTRGAMKTPEQATPKEPLPSPWEACYTLGHAWQYQPTNENYKSANTVIKKLIEIRAKGGNLLLNFGPDRRGSFPPEQWAVLNEISLWMFINKEAMTNTTSCPVVRDDNVWYLQNKKAGVVYAFICEDGWKLGERKQIALPSIRSTDKTKVSVLGHNGKVLEYKPQVDPSPSIKSVAGGGSEMSVMRAQRIYDDRAWPNPIVVKMEGVSIGKNEK
ncbi:alpha-L-fucosidase [Niabella ginsengisoli]|uniref:alpha-L-fucosidase n=1 Tax=Niabella ginsengisoli TaxID=522298 RepID=A0ABS9SGM2_9BACT|nr:alpha-L-fucosidase [Niabella ginsengisoli]MCH5597509.1 alpha-L-fucosidase [Niabella ginsengisoli]